MDLWIGRLTEYLVESQEGASSDNFRMLGAYRFICNLSDREKKTRFHIKNGKSECQLWKLEDARAAPSDF